MKFPDREQICEVVKKLPVQEVKRGVQVGAQAVQALVKRFGLKLLLLGVPLLESDQPSGPEMEQQAPSEEQVFVRNLDGARENLKKRLENTKLNSSQRAILEEALALPEPELMAVAIKESRLDPNAKNGGYFQLTTSAVKDLNRIFGANQFSLDLNAEDNIEAGLIYLALLRHEYIAPHDLAQKMSVEDQRLLAHFFYNMGPTASKKIWEETSATDLASFEDEVVELLGNKMSLLNKLGLDFVGPSSEETVTDPNYHVEYEQSGAEEMYLESLKEKDEDLETILDKPFFKGQKYPDIRKVIISLRYLHLTEAISKRLSGDREDYFDEMFEGSKEMARAPEITVTVAPGDTLWELSQKHGLSVRFIREKNGLSSDALEPGMKLKIPQPSSIARFYLYTTKIGSVERPWIQVTKGGFYSTLIENDEYRAYLNEAVPLEKEDLETGIFDFNKTFNPEFEKIENVNSIPTGVLIWIPNVDYFIAYFKNTVGDPISTEEGDDDEEEEDDDAIPTSINSKQSGQYVKKSGGKWVLDKEMTARGAEDFPDREWSDHPKWTSTKGSDGDLVRRRFGGKDGLGDVRWVVLHSTISSGIDSTVNPKEKAHFVVERDGTIHEVVSLAPGSKASDRIPPHAGVSCWDGVQDLNRYAVGIEVVAGERQEWSSAQFKAVGDLVEWLGGYFDLEKNDIVTHMQIAADRRYGRGRKSDPYAQGADASFWTRLDLPNNSALLDLCVARGSVKPNISAIKGDKNHTGVWVGLSAADERF